MKLRDGEGFLTEIKKKGVEEMMKKTEGQDKKKGMYLVATFGAVAVIALGALAIGKMTPNEGTKPNRIDLNASPTPGTKPEAVAKQDTPKPVTPAPTQMPEQQKPDTEQKTPDSKTDTPAPVQTADTDLPEEDTAVSNPDGVIKGLNFSAETGMLWPVSGEALIPFSPDHAVYHKTLDSYRTSEYVLLGAEVGTHVSAAADGVVTSIKEELKTGTTVTMKVSADYEIVYGMLADVTVKEGDLVDAGTVFATVAEPTRYYVEDGSGTYIQVLFQGEPVNPMLFLR